MSRANNLFYGPAGFKPANSMTGTWRLERPVINMEKCIMCGNCTKYCPLWIVELDRDKKLIEIDYEYCKGCGICANECPKDAIDMNDELEEANKEVK